MKCGHVDHKGRRCVLNAHAGLHSYGQSSKLRAARLVVKLRSKGRCEADLPGVCTIRAEHAHHKQRRSQGGRDDTVNLLDVCSPCHRWIHDNPTEARQRGLLVST